MLYNESCFLNSVIYKIECSITNQIYVGATTRCLKSRLAHHQTKYNPCKTRTFKEYKMSVLEFYPCLNKQELNKKEREWIQKINCCNYKTPGRTQEEWVQDNRNYLKLRNCLKYKKNKDKLKKYANEYYQNNINNCKERKKLKYTKDKLFILNSQIKNDNLPLKNKNKYNRYIKKYEETIKELEDKLNIQ